MTSTPEKDGFIPLKQMIHEYILTVYKATGENKTKTAKILKVGLRTVQRRINGATKS